MPSLRKSMVEYKGRKFEFYDSEWDGCSGCPFANATDAEIFGKCKIGNEFNLLIQNSDYDDKELFCKTSYKFREITEINF